MTKTKGTSTPALVQDALRSAGKPLDAYQLAKLTGLTPMEAGRTAFKMAKKGTLRFVDAVDTANDLSCRVELVG